MYITISKLVDAAVLSATCIVIIVSNLKILRELIPVAYGTLNVGYNYGYYVSQRLVEIVIADTILVFFTALVTVVKSFSGECIYLRILYSIPVFLGAWLYFEIRKYPKAQPPRKEPDRKYRN